MVQSFVQGLPVVLQLLVVQPHGGSAHALIGVQDDFEAMAVHTSTGMPFGNVRQSVSRFETKTAPDMGMIVPVKIHALICSTAHPYRKRAAQSKTVANPTRQILIRGVGQQLVEQAVIQRLQGRFQAFIEQTGLATGKRQSQIRAGGT